MSALVKFLLGGGEGGFQSIYRKSNMITTLSLGAISSFCRSDGPYRPSSVHCSTFTGSAAGRGV